MKEEEIRSTLTIPLYWTFHLEDMGHFKGLSSRELQEFREGHSQEELSAMVEALAWAKEHPQEDFSSMLPGLLPSNEQLYRYLTILHQQFSRLRTD
jgi:hypothetical protein